MCAPHPLYYALDARAWDELPSATWRKVKEGVRHEYMIEVLANGTVPLNDVAQIDGVLDAVKPPERMPLLRRIEQACQRRVDSEALGIIRHWLFLRQQPARASDGMS
jgi:hypothetical protein